MIARRSRVTRRSQASVEFTSTPISGLKHGELRDKRALGDSPESGCAVAQGSHRAAAKKLLRPQRQYHRTLRLCYYRLKNVCLLTCAFARTRHQSRKHKHRWSYSRVTWQISNASPSSLLSRDSVTSEVPLDSSRVLLFVDRTALLRQTRSFTTKRLHRTDRGSLPR